MLYKARGAVYKEAFFMQDYIEKRVMEISNYIIESGSTVRQTAGIFGVSKSTVHMDVTKMNGCFA